MTQQTAAAEAGSPRLNAPLRTVEQVLAARWKVGRSYLTRGALNRRRPVRILATDLRGDLPVAGAFLDSDGAEEVVQFHADGSFKDDGTESTLDLTLDFAP